MAAACHVHILGNCEVPAVPQRSQNIYTNSPFRLQVSAADDRVCAFLEWLLGVAVIQSPIVPQLRPTS